MPKLNIEPFSGEKAWNTVSLIVHVLDYAPKDGSTGYWGKFAFILESTRIKIEELQRSEATLRVRNLISFMYPYYKKKYLEVANGTLTPDELKEWIHNGNLNRRIKLRAPSSSRVHTATFDFFRNLEVTSQKIQAEGGAVAALIKNLHNAFSISPSEVQKHRSAQTVNSTEFGPCIYDSPDHKCWANSDIWKRFLLEKILNHVFSSHPSKGDLDRICSILRFPVNIDKIDCNGRWIDTGLPVDFSKFVLNLNE